MSKKNTFDFDDWMKKEKKVTEILTCEQREAVGNFIAFRKMVWEFINTLAEEDQMRFIGIFAHTFGTPQQLEAKRIEGEKHTKEVMKRINELFSEVKEEEKRQHGV